MGFYGSQYENYEQLCFDLICLAYHVLGTEFDRAAIPPHKSVSWNVTRLLWLSALHLNIKHDTGYQIWIIQTVCTAGVVVSCKIPILATRVRFPGSAQF